MKLTALPYIGALRFGNDLRTQLARAVTYIEVYGVRADTSQYTSKLLGLLSAAAVAASAAPRKTAPAPLTATARVNQPRTVVIDFGCHLAVPNVPAAGAFTVSGVAAVSCQIVGRFVVLVTASDVGATFPVVYTKPGSNPLVDSSANQVASFTITGTRV